MKEIVLIDSNSGGHHSTYLKQLIKSFSLNNFAIKVFTAENREIADWIRDEFVGVSITVEVFLIQDISMNFFVRILKLPSPFITILRWIQAIYLIKNIRSNNIALVFFGWIDNYFSSYVPHQFIDLFFHYPWTGIYFEASKHLEKNENHARIGISEYCKCLFLLDEFSISTIRKNRKIKALKFPDFTDECKPSFDLKIFQEIKERSTNRKIIGVFGALSKRKGILTLLKATDILDEHKFFFIFIGKLDLESFHATREQESLKYYIDNSKENIYFCFKRLPNEENFNACISICDIVFASYEDFPGSSNILTKASLFKKPIIVSKNYCMGARVNEYQLGVTIPEKDPIACAEAIKWLTSDKYQKSINLGTIKPKYNEYHKINSLAELNKVLKSLIS